MILFETIKPKLFEILTTEPAFSTGVYRDEWASCLKEKKVFENSPSQGANSILRGKRGARVRRLSSACMVCTGAVPLAQLAEGHACAEGTLGRTLAAPWPESWSLELQVVSLQIVDISLTLLCCVPNPDARSRFLLLFQAPTSHVWALLLLCLSSAFHPQDQPQMPPFVAVPGRLSSSTLRGRVSVLVCSHLTPLH